MEARAKGRACATVDLCVGVGGLAWRELSGKFDLKPFPIDNWDNFSLGRAIAWPPNLRIPKFRLVVYPGKNCSPTR